MYVELLGVQPRHPIGTSIAADRVARQKLHPKRRKNSRRHTNGCFGHRSCIRNSLVAHLHQTEGENDTEYARQIENMDWFDGLHWYFDIFQKVFLMILQLPGIRIACIILHVIYEFPMNNTPEQLLNVFGPSPLAVRSNTPSSIVPRYHLLTIEVAKREWFIYLIWATPKTPMALWHSIVLID